MIIKTCVLLLILMLTPSGRVYSPAAQTSPAHKPVAITAPVKTAPAPTSAVDYTSKPAHYGSPVHKSAPITLPTPVQPAPITLTPQPSSDKYDGDCQPDATVGRCADKCPAPNSEGVYYPMGLGQNGQLVCGFSYYHACPYSDGVSADDPLCYKNCLNTNPQAATDPTVCNQLTGYTQ